MDKRFLFVIFEYKLNKMDLLLSQALWCIIHTAMLCVEDATDIVVCHIEVTKLLTKAHELVVFIRRTENRRCVLKNACQKANISFSLSARCVETRFNTNAIMLVSILKLKPAFRQTTMEMTNGTIIFSQTENLMLRKV